MAITDEMIKRTYEIAKQVYSEQISQEEGAKKLNAYPRQQSTTKIWFNNFKCLLKGHVYKRIMPKNLTKYFLDMIKKDYGYTSFKKALNALKLHTQYIESLGNKSNVTEIYIYFIKNNEIEYRQSDLTDIISSSAGETEKLRQIQCRIGQGEFRESLIKLWQGCSVTRYGLVDILRASHIKPWCVSSDDERLDQFNGFLLTPNLDAAFDKGLISFNDDGTILIAEQYKSALQELGIFENMKINLKEENKKYLMYHRKYVFIDALKG
ncbi:MAG: HNH endonuclease [Treponema sp.]|jgi:hypothetical protein|nr:HNH endonuclease [Treponema sp.]